MILRRPLPIDQILPAITLAWKNQKNIIIKASPGSGKTTRVPPALLESCSGKVLVLEPRRVAARLSALRVADELGVKVGDLVGYHFRFENCTSEKTRLVYLTEGLLVRRLLSDPMLSGVDCVVLDEFHERHLHTDIALMLLRSLQRTKRPDLKILVMSATLDLRPLEAYLEVESSLSLDLPIFPIEFHYLERTSQRPVYEEVKLALKRALSFPGDILVFLPGRREIEKTRQALQADFAELLDIRMLYGDLPVEEQVRVLTKGERRRVILATNIAETSLTIEGVRQVIDSGLARQSKVSPISGVSVLETKSISRSSAIQRAGRAGRTAEGVCWRLYTKADYESRIEFETAEIHRTDLSLSALEILSFPWLGTESIPWYEEPQNSRWRLALQNLTGLGALAEGSITKLGSEMVNWALPPRLSRTLLEAERLGVGRAAAPLVASLGEGEYPRLNFEHLKQADISPRTQRFLSTLLKRTKTIGEDDTLVVQAFMAGFRDRVAKVRRATQEAVELQLSSGGSLLCDRSDPVWTGKNQYVIVLEGQESKEKGRTSGWARAILPVTEESLLSGADLTESLTWNDQSQQVEKLTQLHFGELVLMRDKEEVSESDYPGVLTLICEKGLGLRAPFTQDQAFTALSHVSDIATLKSDLARLLLAEPLLKTKIPGFKNSADWLRIGLAGIKNLKDIAKINWMANWIEAFGRDQQQELRREIAALVPEELVLNPRRKVKVHYELDRPPWIESRIQDFFGMTVGPKILKGNCPLVLHLLAPNQRAVQVTQDLAGFWKNHYQTIKQELKRRYPRHKWPEDPLKPFSEETK